MKSNTTFFNQKHTKQITEVDFQEETHPEKTLTKEFSHKIDNFSQIQNLLFQFLRFKNNILKIKMLNFNQGINKDF